MFFCTEFPPETSMDPPQREPKPLKPHLNPNQSLQVPKRKLPRRKLPRRKLPRRKVRQRKRGAKDPSNNLFDGLWTTLLYLMYLKYWFFLLQVKKFQIFMNFLSLAGMFHGFWPLLILQLHVKCSQDLIAIHYFSYALQWLFCSRLFTASLVLFIHRIECEMKFYI